MRWLVQTGLLIAGCAAMPLAGCSLTHTFEQCQSDAECAPSSDGLKQYCTVDHFCAVGRPKEVLCLDKYPADAPDNAVVIGGLAQVFDGNDGLVVKAWKLGINEINQRRQDVPPLVLYTCEVGLEAGDAAKSVQYLIREKKAVGFVGPTTSTKTFAIKDSLIAAGVPMVSPSATSPEISSLGTTMGPVNGIFYRVVPADNLQGPMIKNQLAAKLPTETLGIIHVDDQYGIGLKDAFLRAYGAKENFLAIVKEPAGGLDMASINAAASMMLTNKPDYLVAITVNSSAALVSALVNLPVAPTTPNTKIIMTDGAKNETLLALRPPPTPPAHTVDQLKMLAHLKRISGTAPTVARNEMTIGAYTSFLSAFTQRWGLDPTTSIFSAYGYDAVYALGIAIGACGTDVTPMCVSGMLGRFNKLNPSTGACILEGTFPSTSSNQVAVGLANYLPARNAVSMREGLVLQGTTGPICFTPHGDRSSGLYEKWCPDTVNLATGSFRLDANCPPP